MAPGSKPLSYSHDLTRDEIIARFRDRIAQGKRTKLFKDELGQLILHFIDRLPPLNSAANIRALCEAEISLLEEGYPQSTLASDYIPKYRKAIETAIAEGKIPTTKNNSHHYIHTQRVTGVEEERFEHHALTYFKYDKEVYESLDKRSADTNRTRQVNLRSVEPHDYLLKLAELLDANDKFAARNQALAIAGLTGRRIGEVLAKGQFQLSTHPHLLRFEGHQKTEVAAYDIVTLIPAEQLLEYIQQFRASDEILLMLQLEGDALTKAINQLDVQINRECVKHLGSIVPPLSARNSISIHNLRSLWGALAVWLFCPNNQHEYPFIQHYLGHAIDSNATGHYFRYQLVDKAGHPLRDKGVKLAQVGELPLKTDDTAATPIANTQNQILAQSSDSAPLSEIPATIDLPVDQAAAQPTLPDCVPSSATSDTDSNDQMKADSTIPAVAQTPVQEKDSPVAVATPPDIPGAATSDSDSKVAKLSYYQRDRHRLIQLLDAVSPTDTSQQQKMAALLDWAEQQLSHSTEDPLNRIKVGQPSTRISQHPQQNSIHGWPTLSKFSAGDDTQPISTPLHKSYPHLERPQTTTISGDSTDNPSTAYLYWIGSSDPDSQRSVDTDDATPGAGQSVDVVDVASSKHLPPSTPTSAPPPTSPLELLVAQAVTDQARTLGVLASRVEALESQLAILHQERDHALDQLAHSQSIPTQLTQQIANLQLENAQLRSSLERFEAIRRAFLSSSPHSTPADSAPATPPSPTITEADSSSPPAPVPTPPTNTTSNGVSANSPHQLAPKLNSPPSSAKYTNSDRPRRQRAAKTRAESIFHALIAWNQQHADDTFAMTPWLLEGVFKVNRKAAKEFCQDFHDAIEQHHSEIGIENVRSHNSGRNTSALKAFVEHSDSSAHSLPDTPPSLALDTASDRIEQAF